MCYSDIVKDGLFNIRYEQSKKLIKVTAPSVNFFILATAVEESICHFYFPDALRSCFAAVTQHTYKKAPTLTPTVMKVTLCGPAITVPEIRQEQRSKLTEKGNSKPLQDASPPPKEEITPGVCQETYYSTGEGDQKVSDGQIDNYIVQGLSELFELESDKHDEKIFAQRQRGDHKHEHGQDGEVPLRDIVDGSSKRIISRGEFSCHSVGHRVH